MMYSGQTIETCYGLYTVASKPRLNMTYDYEHGTLQAFHAAAKFLEVTNFVDVGANIGCYSVYLSDIASVKSIHAFEPAPIAFKEMERNISLQASQDLFHLYDIAASDKVGAVPFHLVGPMAGNNSIEHTGKKVPTVTVKVAPIDTVVQVENKSIAIKVDVEGHELQVINGMKNLLLANRCLLQVESLEPALAKAMESILSLIGYKRLFVLRDDYIFISQEFDAKFYELQSLYFKYLQEELREFLEIKNKKRSCQGHILELAAQILYTKDPLSL